MSKVADPLDWLIDDGDAPLFQHTDVLMLTDLPSATLQAWAARGIVTPVASIAGNRRYSAHTVVAISMARALMALGVGTSESHLYASLIWLECMKLLHKSFSESCEHCSMLLRTFALIAPGIDGKPTITVETDMKFPAELLMKGMAVVFFPCGIVINNSATASLELHRENMDPAKYGTGKLAVGGRP